MFGFAYINDTRISGKHISFLSDHNGDYDQVVPSRPKVNIIAITEIGHIRN
jgi:hypothetical protein